MMALRTVALLVLVGIAVVQGSSFTFDDGGSLGIRPGCPLDVLGKTELFYEKHEAPCADEEDQQAFKDAVETWRAAGATWVEACGEDMAKGCPPVDVKKELKNGKPYESKPKSWVRSYGGETTFSGIDKGVWKTSLFDVRAGKFTFKDSIIQYINGFLYMVQGGILVLNNAHVYSEDNADDAMGAAVIGVNAKVGCLNASEFVQQDSTLALKDSKFWVQGSFVKQIGGAFVIQNTTFVSEKSEIQFWGTKQAVIARSVWNLTDTQVTLRESFLRIYDTTIVMSGTSSINLKDGTRVLLSNVKIVGEPLVAATPNLPDGFGVTVGQPLDAMNIDFTLTEGQQEITLGPAKAAAAKAADKAEAAHNGK